MSKETLKIDLGCGLNKKEGFKGMDILNLPGIEYVVDIENGLGFIEDNLVEEYFTSHFLEHIQNLEFVLEEIHRTLKINGQCTIIVPHFSNPYFYSDYTHKRFFGLYSLDYFSISTPKIKRKVPNYSQNFRFEVLERKLIFKSPRFPLINLLKKHIVQRFFNLSPYFQELYEGLFTKVFSCSEIYFKIKPIKS